ncbi:MAG: hypothetical protein M1814_004343 [Vezdaea aestivalis]|nr:MAG: hypothetical protein M1814_004343 [Vezdaea aestivalis]
MQHRAETRVAAPSGPSSPALPVFTLPSDPIDLTHSQDSQYSLVSVDSTTRPSQTRLQPSLETPASSFPVPTQDTDSSQSGGPVTELREREACTELVSADVVMKDSFRTPRVRSTNTSPVTTAFPKQQTAGQKRTASGAIKEPSASLPTSPLDILPQTHSRTASVESNSSRFSEIGAQLRSRLSYAMVKVQHGWEKHSLEEIEQLAEQKLSPTSTSAPTLLTSPRPSRVNSNGITQRPAFSNGHPGTLHTRRPSDLAAAGPRSAEDAQPTKIFGFSPRDQPIFHTSRGPLRQSPLSPTSPRAVLGPPAPIGLSRRPQREYTPSFANGSRTGSNLSNSSRESPFPSTPPPRKEHLSQISTPQQNTAQEQDVVEALLNMSSPGNSQKPGFHTMPSTPLQPPVGFGKRVVFAAGLGSGESSEEERARRMLASPKRDRQILTWRQKDEAIDRILDTMEDEASSDEDMGVQVRRPL